MNNPLDFSGKVAAVTGAGAGMGLATARAFAESLFYKGSQKPAKQATEYRARAPGSVFNLHLSQWFFLTVVAQCHRLRSNRFARFSISNLRYPI